MKGTFMKSTKGLLSLCFLLSSIAIADVPKKNDETRMNTTEGLVGAPEMKRDNLKIGYVDAFKIMQESKFGVQTGEELMATNKKWSEEIAAKGREIEQDMMNYEKKKHTMGEESRIREENRLKKAQIDYKAHVEEKNQEFQRQQQKATEAILAQVKDAAAEVARVEKLDVVIDKTTGQVLWNSTKADLSDKIIASMDKKFTTPKITVADNKKVNNRSTAA